MAEAGETLAEKADQLVEETVTYLLEQTDQRANWILYTHYAADELEEPAINIASQNAGTARSRLEKLTTEEGQDATDWITEGSSIPE